jgi:predicted amidohydrolase YtcJ
MPSLEGHPIFDIVKPDRVPLCWPGKSLVEAGATVAFGTDYPIVDLDHADSLYRAVKRRMLDNLPEEGWNPQEKFTVAEAIKNHTYGVAYMLNHDNIIGTLEEGKLADINVFDKNIFADEEELPNMKCSMTVFNGEIVYIAE